MNVIKSTDINYLSIPRKGLKSHDLKEMLDKFWTGDDLTIQILPGSVRSYHSAKHCADSIRQDALYHGYEKRIRVIREGDIIFLEKRYNNKRRRSK